MMTQTYPSKPLVSIVTSCYNQAEYLPECIASVQAQTFKVFEHIIVVPGSTDNSIEVAINSNWGKVISCLNKGTANNKNMGFAEATGQYGLSLDADDLIAPTFLEEVVKRAAQQTVVATGITRFGLVNNRELPSVPCSYADICRSNHLYTTSLFPMDAFRECGGYDPRIAFCEDWALFCDLFRVGCKAVLVPEYLFHYRVRHHYEDYTTPEQRQAVIDYVRTKHPLTA